MSNLDQLIEKLKKFLLDSLQKSSHDNSEINYYYEHSLRVANIGSTLADKENANKKIVIVACLLHDLAIFNVSENQDHGRESAKLARPFLETLDLTKTEIDDICYAIGYHFDGNSGYNYVHTLEASIVSDADNIDSFGMSSAYRFINKLEKYPKEKKIEKLKRHEKKLASFKRLCIAVTSAGGIVRPLETKTGCAWFRDQLELQLSIYQRLIEEYLWF